MKKKTTIKKSQPPNSYKSLYFELSKLDKAVDSFAAVMKARLHEKAFAGRKGWDDSVHGQTDDAILDSLVDDIGFKGSRCIDIANKAMILWYRKVMGV